MTSMLKRTLVWTQILNTGIDIEMGYIDTDFNIITLIFKSIGIYLDSGSFFNLGISVDLDTYTDFEADPDVDIDADAHFLGLLGNCVFLVSALDIQQNLLHDDAVTGVPNENSNDEYHNIHLFFCGCFTNRFSQICDFVFFLSKADSLRASQS